jgi:hypothetical protein
MPVEQARAYSDRLYPPSADDIDYEDRLRRGETHVVTFPWISFISLLYPLAATVYIAIFTPVEPSMVLGYGMVNLAYVLLVAGIFTGKFGAFGLRNRWQVLTLAVTCFVFGTYLSNLNA